MKFLIAMGAGEVRDSFFTKRAIAELEKHGEVIFNDTGAFALNKEALMDKIRDIDVLFSGWGTARVDADVLACANCLKIHAHTGGSLAPYISQDEYNKGIIVLSGNDIYAKSVAEGCLCYTLMGLRRARDYVNAMSEEGWRPNPDYNQGLIGRKVGIVGYGAIAKYYVELLRWFEVDLHICSKYISEDELKRVGAQRATLEEIFSECDVISLHSALNAENRGMITADLLSHIKEGALFVNTARAGLIDDEALVRELQTGRFNAVLDVYVKEPLAVDSPYRSLQNALLFPHIAGPTFDMREKVVLELLKDVLRVGAGVPLKNTISYDYAIRMTV